MRFFPPLCSLGMVQRKTGLLSAPPSQMIWLSKPCDWGDAVDDSNGASQDRPAAEWPSSQSGIEYVSK